MFVCKICKKNLSNKGGLVSHEYTCKKTFLLKDEIIKLYVEELWSIRDLSSKYEVGKGIITYLLDGYVRSISESIKIGKKRFPNSHTEESKEKLRKKRLEFMKNNPDKTSWRKKNISYPEKIFLDKITEIEWNKKYTIIRELSVFPFFIDFAFMNEMVAVEIDGSQHLLADRKLRDDKKDEVLSDNGWTIIRVTEKEIKNNLTEIISKIEEVLLSLSKEKKYQFGILMAPKKYEKKPRLENGLTIDEWEKKKIGRKVERPTFDDLKKMIDQFGYVGTGKIFGVSDNAIRKWIKFYIKYKE